MQLSPHFGLAEFIASATAAAQNIDNRPDAAQIVAMNTKICTAVGIATASEAAEKKARLILGSL